MIASIWYTTAAADVHDEFIDWEGRARGEGTFFIDRLQEHGAKKVLDMACGTGYDSVRLLKEGFDVCSADGSPAMLKKAEENGRKHGVRLNTTVAEWRKLAEVYRGEKFDAVIALGNSFPTLVFDKAEQREIAEGVKGLLRPAGVFILDQRNYDKIMDKGGPYTHDYVYCGKNFKVDISKEKKFLKLDYRREGKYLYSIRANPMKFGEVRSLLENSGFLVESYGDFKKIDDLYVPDFFQHVGIKA